MTQVPSFIGLFVAPLNRAGIHYMVTGEVSDNGGTEASSAARADRCTTVGR